MRVLLCDPPQMEIGKLIVLHQAIDFFSNNLFSRPTLQRLKLTINFYYGEDHDYGYMPRRLKHQRQKYNVSIYINKNQPFNVIITTIAHELTHVHQSVTEQLFDFSPKNGSPLRLNFNGREYLLNTPYKYQPWEHTAYANEAYLTDKFDLSRIGQV